MKTCRKISDSYKTKNNKENLQHGQLPDELFQTTRKKN